MLRRSRGGHCRSLGAELHYPGGDPGHPGRGVADGDSPLQGGQPDGYRDRRNRHLARSAPARFDGGEAAAGEALRHLPLQERAGLRGPDRYELRGLRSRGRAFPEHRDLPVVPLQLAAGRRQLRSQPQTYPLAGGWVSVHRRQLPAFVVRPDARPRGGADRPGRPL